MKKLWLWTFAAFASVAVIFSGTPALAVDLRPEDGFDVSYPQCGRTLPTPGAFSIIGVDDGRAFAARDESCLESQLTWAKQGGREIQLYANTGNPGGPWIWDTTVSPRQQLAISNWPSRVAGTNSTKPYPCTSSSPDTYYCAYDYGYRAAYESFQRAKAAFAAAGVGYSPASVNWWLDIEWGIVDGVTEGNTWRGHDDGYIHPNDSKMTMAQKNGRNLWALKGMHDYFVSTARVKQLGFYSSPTAWNTIAASNKRAFADHPFWYPIGPATNEDAVAKCEAWVLNVTGAGQPVMVQYVDTDLNLDRAFDATHNRSSPIGECAPSPTERSSLSRQNSCRQHRMSLCTDSALRSVTAVRIMSLERINTDTPASRACLHRQPREPSP